MSTHTLTRTERRKLERATLKQQRKQGLARVALPTQKVRQFTLPIVLLCLAFTAAVFAVSSSSLRSWFSRPTPLQLAPNQTAIHLDDGGLAYATDGRITAVHGDSPRHRELIGLQYSEGVVDDTDYHPLLWRSVDMSLKKPDGSVAEVSATRPLWWFEITGAKEGVTVPLDIHEAGISGMATVHKTASLADKPFQKPTPGYRPVIGTIKHLNAKVLELFFEGAESDPLGVTPNHPLWSEDRQDWIPAGELRIGETVSTTEASSRLLRRREKPGLHTVHNIEVHRSHSYHVGKLGLLAHNTGLECDRVFSIYELFRKKYSPGDPLAAYERTKNRMDVNTKWSQTLKSETVTGVVDDMKRLNASGELDPRIASLGMDPVKGFDPKEAFAGRRFEMQKGKTLTRSQSPDQDYIDEAGQAWDAFGPIPSKFYKWSDVQASIDRHFLKQGVKNVFDLAGLTDSQKDQMRNYILSKPNWAGRFEFLDD